MTKIVAAINITLDGFCDHTAVTPGEDIHWHYTELIRNAGTILYGRITYQLMESAWPEMVKNPTGNKWLDEFAAAIDDIPKVVFSRTLKAVQWKYSRLAQHDLKDEIAALKKQDGKDVLIGSPSLIAASLNQGLIDELQLMIHPVIAGSGLRLFKDDNKVKNLELLGNKTFSSGAILLRYGIV